jgi:hypothetical protein
MPRSCARCSRQSQLLPSARRSVPADRARSSYRSSTISLNALSLSAAQSSTHNPTCPPFPPGYTNGASGSEHYFDSTVCVGRGQPGLNAIKHGRELVPGGAHQRSTMTPSTGAIAAVSCVRESGPSNPPGPDAAESRKKRIAPLMPSFFSEELVSCMAACAACMRFPAVCSAHGKPV